MVTVLGEYKIEEVVVVKILQMVLKKVTILETKQLFYCDRKQYGDPFAHTYGRF